jgi:uncharacterized protein (DUF608 family)
MNTDRRFFLQVLGAAPAAPSLPSPATAATPIVWPRRFTGRQLAKIAFPLGGIAAGSISLGGRGQLLDWEIFNRPDKGNQPAYAFASIWAQPAGGQPVARIAETRILPPFDGQNGLGSNNAPGLPRLDSAVFTGQYPIARLDFKDRALPIRLSLEAFTPIIPLDADASGLPAAILRYRATNPTARTVACAMSFSIDNPVGAGDGRVNTVRESDGLRGVLMTNDKLAPNDPLQGSFALAALTTGHESSVWRGWPRGRWWNAPMLFWDEFSAHGLLGAEPDPRNATAAVSLRREIPPGGSAEFSFILAWRFPNRTPRRCGWTAPPGDEDTIIGNWYCTQFQDAFQAAETLARRLPALEPRTRAFLETIDKSSLPGAIKDAAMSNLSTLATQVCFRTADGEFHGFEGANDKAGCCYGSCTHVWNYESTTAHLFPALSRSLREAAFGFPMDDRGAMHFREVLPPGKTRSSIVAADGQMGQVMKAYLDWRLSGDQAFLQRIWPRVKKAIEFCWIPGGWDADRDGVMEGAQHNTYDVEFYGPNPQCGIYYLGGLRAAEELARAAGDASAAQQYRALFEKGAAWIDAHLFNGEYYIQKVQGIPRAQVAEKLISTMGSENTEQPEYQMGEGCLADQLIGQYQSDVCGLGPLVNAAHLRATLASILRYNFRRDLSAHASVQRTYALNDEAGLIICDYGKKPRPRIPFPYFAEVWTSFEYMLAAQLLWAGQVEPALELTAAARRRHDGERRNPWDEEECGHHYARAMAAWSPVLAFSGFLYDAPRRHLSIKPVRRSQTVFRCFWSTASGWGWFSLGPRFTIYVQEGALAFDTLDLGRPVNLRAPVRLSAGQQFTTA